MSIIRYPSLPIKTANQDSRVDTPPRFRDSGWRDRMLEVRNISKFFGGVQAVRNCSFTVNEGTITGLIGPNGAGKTTIFNIITGFIRPDRGNVLFRGTRIDGFPPHRIFKNRIYRTFQISREFARMTVLENLMLIPRHQSGERIWNTFLRSRRVREQEADLYQRGLEVLEFVDLLRLKDEYAGTLSGGQKKLLEIARALMADPALILLDEPGAGVNPTLMRSIVDRIQQLAASGITFLLIEHDMELVMSLCDPVIVMSEGARLAEGTPEQVRTNRDVLDAYLGGQYR